MNILTFICTCSGYRVVGINCVSPTNKCFKSKELAIHWIEDRFPGCYGFKE